MFGDSTPVLASGQAFRNYRCIPLLRDMDNDSVKDLTLGEWYSSIRFYHNSGTNSDPLFTTFVNLVAPDPDSFRNGNPPRIALADWDGDSDLDMITCDYYGWVTLRENITVTGIGGESKQRSASALPTVLTRAQLLAELQHDPNLSLLDATGRAIYNPKSEICNLKSPSGVYFLQKPTSTRKLVLGH
ncbi:MAG: VCBS repeat-containing protein [candidate division WOR-3 bacterium]|nr:MAG: VCBS repeat-containing protein [candidate division WOR-3 bacterium]